jgi:hypothetical protein
LNNIEHPRCRITPIAGVLSPVNTDKGPLPPERALAYNQSELLLHGAASTRPGHHFSAAELVGYGKTANRLLALLRKHPWTQLQPLEWLSPEELLFRSSNDALLYDLVHLSNHLEQAETLTLHTLDAWTFLAFRRC